MAPYDLSSQLDPVYFAQRHLRLHLDPWQAKALCHDRVHLNCARQSGKTTAAAVRAAHHAIFTKGAEILIVSATEVQAGETAQRIQRMLHQLGESTRKLPGRRYDFMIPRTGARVRVLPCREAAMRGYTATFVIIDEAALVPDAVYHALIGTLASTWLRAIVWMISTPREPRGFFYERAIGAHDGWLRLIVPAAECSRITAPYLAEQRRTLPEWRFNQDFCCRFGDTAHAYVTEVDLAALGDEPGLPCLSPHRIEILGAPPSRFHLGLDHGQSNDHPALTALQHRPHYLGLNRETHHHEYQGRLVFRYIERLPLGIHYPDLVAFLRKLLSYPEIQRHGADLVFDATAANVFTDYLRAARLGVTLVPVIITTGTETTYSNGKWHVPKPELFNNLSFLIRQRNLKIAPGAGHVEEFKRELSSIRRLVTPHGHELFSPVAGSPDDLVSSATLSAWNAMRLNKHSLLKDAA